MITRKLSIMAAAVVLTGGAWLGSTGTSLADEPDPDSTAFLCPIVGDGVMTADANNGDNGVSVINPPAGTSFLPGNNQAGAAANDSALNTDNPDNPDAGPGGNPDYTPIWPG